MASKRKAPGKGKAGKQSSKKPAAKTRKKTTRNITENNLTTQGDPDRERIGERSFRDMNRGIANHQGSIDDARGAISGIVREAVKKHRVNPRAHNIYRSLARLSDAKLRDTRDELLHYFEIGGLNARCEAQAEAFKLNEMNAMPAPEKPKRARREKAPPVDVSSIPPESPPQMDLAERHDIVPNGGETFPVTALN